MDIGPSFDQQAHVISRGFVVERVLELVGHVVLEHVDNSSVGGEVNGHREPLLSCVDWARDTIGAGILVGPEDETMRIGLVKNTYSSPRVGMEVHEQEDLFHSQMLMVSRRLGLV